MLVFLSYPKSGRTWVRFMVNSYWCRLHGLSVTNVFEAEKHATAPCRVEWTHLSAAMLMRRHYWEMGPFDLGPARSWPWLLLVRNFYATMASAYHQARDRIRVFDGPPGAFLRSPRYGVVKLVTFYNLWEQLKTQVPNHQVLCYEQLVADPVSALRRIVEAMGLPLRGDLVQGVAAEASFENMKRLSTTADYAGTVLAPKDPADPNTYKVRKGGGGGFDQLFNDEDLAYIDGIVDALLVKADAEEYQACRGAPGGGGAEGGAGAGAASTRMVISEVQ